MRRFVILTVVLGFMGCGGGGDVRSRCVAAVTRANADPECAPIRDPESVCQAYVLTYSVCRSEIDAFLSCGEALSDICPASGLAPCAAENTAAANCIITADVDAGR